MCRAWILKIYYVVSMNKRNSRVYILISSAYVVLILLLHCKMQYCYLFDIIVKTCHYYYDLQSQISIIFLIFRIATVIF